MVTKTDHRLNQYLEVNIELHSGVTPSPRIKVLAKRIIRKNLIDKSSEFAEISKNKNTAHVVRCILWENGHPKYFKPGTKQKWVMK